MWNWIDKASELKKTQEPFAIATITKVAGSAPRDVGAKMIVSFSGEFFGTIGGGALESLVLQDAKKCLLEEKSGAFSYPLGPKAQQCCGGLVETLVEVVNLRPELFVFGAGHVGQAVASVFDGTEFVVTLIDDREEWIGSSAISNNTIKFFGNYHTFLSGRKFSAQRSHFVVMTHSHDLDAEILIALSQVSSNYVGLIGSQSKWNRFEHRLKQAGVSESFIAQIKCPIGFQNLGKAPKEVAISLGAELLQLRLQKEQSYQPLLTHKLSEQSVL